MENRYENLKMIKAIDFQLFGDPKIHFPKSKTKSPIFWKNRTTFKELPPENTLENVDK